MKLSETALQQKVDFDVSRSKNGESAGGQKPTPAGSGKKFEYGFPDQFGFYPEENGVVIRREE